MFISNLFLALSNNKIFQFSQSISGAIFQIQNESENFFNSELIENLKSGTKFRKWHKNSNSNFGAKFSKNPHLGALADPVRR